MSVKNPLRSYIQRSEVYDLISAMSKTIKGKTKHQVQIEDEAKKRKITLLFCSKGLPSGLDGSKKKIRNIDHTVELTIQEGFISNSFGYASPKDFYNVYQFNYGPDERRFAEVSDYDLARDRARVFITQKYLKLRPRRF